MEEHGDGKYDTAALHACLMLKFHEHPFREAPFDVGLAMTVRSNVPVSKRGDIPIHNTHIPISVGANRNKHTQIPIYVGANENGFVCEKTTESILVGANRI